MPISLVNADQLHLGFLHDPLIVHGQCLFRLSDVAILKVDAVGKEANLLVLLKLSVPHVMANVVQ